jgi:hypothetical protein
MSRWEDALREALRREDAPDGFAERVLAKAKAEAAEGSKTGHEMRWPASLLAAFRIPQLRWATALAAVALAVGTVEYRGEMEKRAEGERARDQVMLALRITGGKLRETQAMIRKIDYAPREQ